MPAWPYREGWHIMQMLKNLFGLEGHIFPRSDRNALHYGVHPTLVKVYDWINVTICFTVLCSEKSSLQSGVSLFLHPECLHRFPECSV